MTRSNTFNWGGAIVLSFVVFAGFIGTMVYRMISQRVDLVADNYYQEEVYQKQIERIQHTSLLKQKSSMTLFNSRSNHSNRLANFGQRR
jgi:hypothetical protein